MVRFNTLIGAIVIGFAGLLVFVSLGKELGKPIVFGMALLIALFGVSIIAGGQLIQVFVSIEENTRAKPKPLS